MMRKKMLFAFLLSMLLCASCSDSPTMKEVFCLENDTVNDQRGRVVHDFDGKLANDSAFSDGYAFCRQQQLKDSDFYYAVFPESNYVVTEAILPLPPIVSSSECKIESITFPS